jgi:hypothetical protein
MAYYERRYEATISGGPVDKLGRDGSVLCDRCGFDKHHRPTRDGDCAAALCTPVPGWTWDPTGRWCWNRRWSTGFHACEQCGRDANEPVSLDVIHDELLALEVS